MAGERLLQSQKCVHRGLASTGEHEVWDSRWLSQLLAVERGPFACELSWIGSKGLIFYFGSEYFQEVRLDTDN